MSNIHFELFKFMNEHGDKTQDVRESVMTDREKVIKGLEIQLDDLQRYTDSDEILTLTQEQAKEMVAMLKEQEAVEPRRDAICVRMFRCGACGEYVGFIDSDPGDPNEQDNYCRNCGRPVKWG